MLPVLQTHSLHLVDSGCLRNRGASPRDLSRPRGESIGWEPRSRAGFLPRLDAGTFDVTTLPHADRILLGSDIGWDDDQEKIGELIAGQEWPARCARLFGLLETDDLFGDIRGLALPGDVLEMIYYRNAMRVYPRVADSLKALGYCVGP